METITRAAEDHLKAIWSSLEWGGPAITVKRLAQRFGTTPASASDTVRRLAVQGLVRHEPYRAIELTAEGERVAVAVVRRHRLIETFLVEHLGYGWDEVHLEAESLEHAASDLMIERIDDLLGNPTVDPHGDPIPDRFGTVVYPAGARRLTDAAPGRYRATRISDEDPERLAHFESAGLVTGAPLTVHHREEDGAIAIAIADKRLALAAEAAEAIIVTAL